MTHFASLPRGFAQKTLYPSRAVEATCGIRMGCKCQNIAHLCLSLMYSTTVYCAPVWCRKTHTRLIDSIFNDTLRIVTVCMRPTPMENLSVFAGIQPAELRQLGATLSLANCAIHGSDHVLHGQLVGQQDAHLERLGSSRPFVSAVWKLLDSLSELDICVKQWTKHK